MFEQNDEIKREITLLSIFLNSWEDTRNKYDAERKIRVAWKGYDFGILDSLQDVGLIIKTPNEKAPLYITQYGLTEAKKIYDKYIR